LRNGSWMELLTKYQDLKFKKMKENIPKQHSPLGQFIKKILHTKVGAFIGFHLGISGFNRIEGIVKDSNGNVIQKGYSYNSRVNVGAGLITYLISGSNVLSLSSPGIVQYMALSTSVLTPAATDTTLSGETAASGMTRSAGTVGTYTGPASLDGAASYILSHTWTNSSGSTVTVQSAAIFDASSSGNMFVEGNTSSAYAIANTNQLTLNWTINL
jgi:hypothetical protein